jgi:hypothetical protein
MLDFPQQFPRTRIVTLAAKKPPVILYKEITPLRFGLP